VTGATGPRWRWLEWRPFGQAASIPDYGITFLAEFATLAAGLLVLRLAAWHWGPTGFGEYVLVRRTLSLIQLPVLCNMGIALSRFVAISKVGGRFTRQSYLVAATIVAVGAASLACLVLLLAAAPTAALMFGKAQYAPLVRAVALAVPGIVLHSVAYGYFRGRLQMLAANALQVVNLGLVPVMIFAIPHLTVLQAVTTLAACWNVVAIIAIAEPLWSAVRASHGSPLPAVRELLHYGLPRVPGEFALAALFSLPTTLAAHFGGIEHAGFVGLGVSLLSMVGSMFAPLGQIVLPSVSAMAAQGETAALRRGVWRLWLASVTVAAAMVAVLAVFARPLIALYVGPAFLPAVPVTRLLLLAGVPYVTYVVLRNVLDALDTRPLNARNLVLALLLFAVVALVAGRPDAVAGAMVTAVIALGLLSFRDARLALRTGASEPSR
jgi:O-antigen/teichoic acid export membrane protein